MQTTTTTTETTTKRWYALVRLDEDGRSVAPQAEEIAKLERELMRSQEVSTGGGGRELVEIFYITITIITTWRRFYTPRTPKEEEKEDE